MNALRDFLPQAEQELKFQPLPEHELAIMQLMERHERFEEQLQVSGAACSASSIDSSFHISLSISAACRKWCPTLRR